MKTIKIVIVFLLLATAFIAPAGVKYTYAQTVESWESGYQVQNLDTLNPAGITITYYNPDGSLATGFTNPVTDTVPANSSNTYATIHPPAPFKGSMVISSDKPLAVITNLIIATTARGMGSYVGFTSGAPIQYFPLIMKGNGNITSNFSIQNVGATSVEVTITFTKEVGSAYADISPITDTIASSAAHQYDLMTLSQFSGVTKWVGSVTATATSGSIAGVANNVNRKYPDAYQSSTYNSLANGSTTVVLPLIQEANNGNRTGVSCQNMGATSADITITYIPEPGNPDKAPQTATAVPAKGMAVFLQAETGTKFVGSGRITSANNVACIVNQQKSSTGRSSAYEGFTSGTGTVVLPLIMSKNGTSVNGYLYTGVSIATVSGASTTVTCDFLPNPGFTDVANQSKTGAVVVFVQDNLYGNGAKFVGAARCTASTPIVAIVNQTRELTPQPIRDVLATYDGFNITP